MSGWYLAASRFGIFEITLLYLKLAPFDQQERKTYDFDGDETKTGSARMVVYVGAM